MGNLKILVVDDEKEICEVTRSFLSKRNYDAFIATNSKETVDIMNAEHPRIILLDMRLGDESGLDVLRAIKEIDNNVMVIMVTALEDEDMARQAKSLGANDYITKPFTSSFLLDLIAKKAAQWNQK